MNTIVGFSLLNDVPEGRVEAALAAQRRVVGAFPHLRSASFTVGLSRLEVWGHGDPAERVRLLADGSVVAIVGSPHGRVLWSDLPDHLLAPGSDGDFELPWEGRVVLVRVSADGRHWTMWNDWVGSIPVFHAPVGAGRVASTLEPVAVAAAALTSDDIFLPALVSILINGHCLSDWTLFKGMRVVPPDSVLEGGGDGVRSRRLWTVRPSDEHWETAWSDLVDEMHELSRNAIVHSVSDTPAWVLPLSAGLDSRLIAGVGAELGADVHAFAWGHRDMLDVVYSRQIARALGIPWRFLELGADYLLRYTQQWAAWFGSSLHFHGMYQMAFLEAIRSEAAGPTVTGFLGDSVNADPLYFHTSPRPYQLYDEWHTHWTPEEVKALLRGPVQGALEENAAVIESERNGLAGSPFIKAVLAEIWERQRLFTSFQCTLSDYWRGVLVPFLDRPYARFCLSLPMHALEGQRLIADVYRRYYGRLATIPGTYGEDPYILTGRYLLRRRLAAALPARLLLGPLRGFRATPPRMDIECVQAGGWNALWPIPEARSRLAEWLDVSMIDREYESVMASKEDMRPLRKLQSIQPFAFRLLA